MPVLNIEGKRVRVDDSFLQLSPEQQNATVDEIAKSVGAQPANAGENQDHERGLLRRVDDAVRGVADMATLGFADEIAAKLGSLTGVGGQSGDYDANLAAQRQRDANGGLERLGGQVAGAFLLPGAAAKSVGEAALKGGLIGATYGYGSGEGSVSNRMRNAGGGAMIGGAAGGTLHKVADALINRAARATIPTNAALRSASKAGYDAADAAGVIVRPEGMQKLATETVNDLAQLGYHPQIQPKIGSILNEMERLANTNTTYKGLDTLRKIAGQVANSQDASERAMATRIIQRLDDYMENLPAQDVITGNAAQASAGIKQGRENWARMRRSEMVDTARIKAERRAASTGTGGNLENAIRQNTRSILDNPKRSRGMTPAEITMAEKVVRGTPTQDALRLVGRLSPTTGGLSAMMNVGAAAYNPMLAIPGAVGMGAKVLADRMTIRNANTLSELIRSGGLTAKDIARQAGKGNASKELVDAVERIRRAEGKAIPSAVGLLSLLKTEMTR